jgi:D-alanyl-D-alanine carboxypeptidase
VRPAPEAAVAQLRLDVQAETTAPGVTRAVWGVVVQSLDRDERLVELNPETLLLPASVAKIVSAVSAADAVAGLHLHHSSAGRRSHRRRGAQR